jgi:serine protease inhibitor
LGIAFDKKADLGRIARASEKELYLSELGQTTFVEVTEEGTEMAAVTEWLLRGTGPVSPVVMRVDRPFFFAIRERTPSQRGENVFAGQRGQYGKWQADMRAVKALLLLAKVMLPGQARQSPTG